MKVGMLVWVKRFSAIRGPALIIEAHEGNRFSVRFEDSGEMTVTASWLEDVCQECQMPSCDCA